MLVPWVSGRQKGRHFCVGGMASLCMMAVRGYRRGPQHIPYPGDRFLGWAEPFHGVCLQLTLALQGAMHKAPVRVFVTESPWGCRGCSISLNLNFFTLLCFHFFLKNGFSVWGKLVKNREHLYRERCSWHACAVPFMLLKSVSVQCFCLLVFLMAQFPLCLPKSVM